MKTRIWYLFPIAAALFTLSCSQENSQKDAAGQAVSTPVGAPVAVAAEMSGNESISAEPNENGWYTSWDAGLAAAKTQGRPIIVDFYTDWCQWCKVMDEKTFSDPSIRKKFADGWVMIKINAENEKAKGIFRGTTLTYRELAIRFGINAYPSYGFIDKEGNPVKIVPGYYEVPQFTMMLDFFLQEIYKLSESEQKKFMATYTAGAS